MPADITQAAAPAPVGLSQRTVLALIRGYQLFLAPMYAGSCRFVPSCSVYASEAVQRYGAARGTVLALRRLLRCRPFGRHGFDPVPAVAPSELRRGTPAAAPLELRGEPDRSCKNTL